MHRRSWNLGPECVLLVCVALSILGVSGSESLGHEEPPPVNDNRPNIIFVLADDLGYGDVGYNGGFASTPNIDEMSRGPHSVKFNQFYSGAPVCSPTRGTLLTGRNHNRYCIWMANTAGNSCDPQGDFRCPSRYPLPLSEVTVAEILKGQGYRTAAFGKWHLGDLKQLSLSNALPPSNPGQNGFDVWKVTERAVPTANPNCACFNSSYCVLGHYGKRNEVFPCTNYHSAVVSDDPMTTFPYDDAILQDDSNFLVDQLLSFISNTTSSKPRQPFFAYVPFHAVHKKYIATAPFDSKYSSDSLSEDEIDYYAAISAMDAAVGRIRSALRELDIHSNTMIWFASDNGPAMNSPGNTAGLRGTKGTLFEGGIRVPGIIEWPKMIRTHREVDTPVVTNDFLPTICDVLGVTPPSDRPLDGESILPLLSEETNRERNGSIKWAFRISGKFNGRYSVAVINSRNFKLIADYKRGMVKKSTLYDLSTDPSESENVSSLHPVIFEQLLKEAESWRLSLRNSAVNEVQCLVEP